MARVTAAVLNSEWGKTKTEKHLLKGAWVPDGRGEFADCYNKLNSGISFMLKRNKLLSYFKSLLSGTFLLYAPEPFLSHICHLLILWLQYFTPSLFHYPVCWMTESNFRQIPTPTKNTTIKNIWGCEEKIKGTLLHCWSKCTLKRTMEIP